MPRRLLDRLLDRLLRLFARAAPPRPARDPGAEARVGELLSLLCRDVLPGVGVVAFLRLALRDRDAVQRSVDAALAPRFRESPIVARTVVELWAAAEMALHPWHPRKVPETYEELYDVTRLQCGDYLPGHGFVLGRERTYGREKLVVDKASPAMLDLLAEARRLHWDPDPGRDAAARAEAVYSMVRGSMRVVEPLVPAGVTMVLSGFLAEGGCCRHASAVLACALQEANVRCRYRRGRVMGRHHAFVEVATTANRAWDLVLDPTFGAVVRTRDLASSLPAWQPDPHANVIWRPRIATP
ncbi:MAG: hypothetical protein FJ087_11155 [Deltaproteobacteria bacterium]|nr:hypothetical protein [Deltaproteobacteria bacterium]